MPEPGESVLHFDLVERIGEGGMGDVWKAIDTRLDREVAIKFLPPAFADDPERLARFEHEARTVAALEHPNIVTIHSVEECGGVHFLTMELIRGQTLSEVVPDNGLRLETFFKVAIPMIQAMTAAHERGVTHRDLKPGNVMVTDDGRVKVLDFGLAKSRAQKTPRSPDDSPTRTITREDRVRGTMPYMSPEQIQGKPLDPRSDVFALGVILYEMATGSRPFKGETSADLLAAILRDNPALVTDVKPALPRQLGRIIRHALEKDPKRRFQTALDLFNELEELRLELQTGGFNPALLLRRATSGPDLTSLAVLPFDNLAGDPEQEFFVDGMTDALINDLAKIGALKVISRTSVMRYKGVRKSVREIGRELGVGAVVDGSVLRADGRVRIMVQLIDAKSDENLWAERYDRELSDVLALHSEVARTIATQVRVKLTSTEQARLGATRPVNPEAHEACLRGRHFWYKRTNEAVRRGLECFRLAIQLDPEYAPAYAGVADSYIVDGGRYLGVPPDEAYAQARGAALDAVRLDDGLAEAHTSLAAVYTDYDWDWESATQEYRRAIQLNPSYAVAHNWFAEHLSRMGLHDEAVGEARRAHELDPLSLIGSVIVAWILFFARRYEEAIVQARRTLELDPEYPTAYRILGWSYEETREHEQAILAHGRAAALSDGSPNFKGQLGRAYALAGRTEQALEILDELMTLSETTPISSFDIAIIHAALGNVDRAIEWLEKAYDEHSDHMPYLNVNPRIDVLRDDPRFQDILGRLGFPEIPASSG